MNLPRATYRLQFREGMDFARAADLAPYLSRLGVSHLYASPIFQAVRGSTHGYDIVDHGKFDDDLGGMDGFLRLAAALKDHGLGLILDIVPNHMAASPQNPWWRDVLRHGPNSVYADYFDIDWSAPRLLLPLLGQPSGAALKAGEFALGHDSDGLTWHYHDTVLPLDPRSWHLVLEPLGIGAPEAEPFASWLKDSGEAQRLAERLAELSHDSDRLDRVHEAQPWRLAYWRAARDALTYRRFFEISDLVGVRVEDDRVFDDVHALLFDMLAAGHVDGIRIDHIDGLADPAGYLRRLKDEAPGNPPIWVEKILAPEEALPAEWPVEGTTGYEFTRAVGGLLTDPGGGAGLATAYFDFVGRTAGPETMLTAAKRQILTYNLAAELSYLTALAGRVAAKDPMARDWGPDTLRRALIAIAIAMPVYRSYFNADGPSARDEALFAEVEREAVTAADLEDAAAVGDLLRLIASGRDANTDRLRRRFQQTTGALMAKAMEDTLFYRYSRLLSANEVGGEPTSIGLTPAAFDREIAARAAEQPGGMNATATHDTKRGEDARMRISAIADAPDAWRDAVGAWDALLTDSDTVLPDAEMRWHFYQALLGAWAPEDMTVLAERMTAYLVKAAREAKRATSWTQPNAAYEQLLTSFVTEALTGDRGFAAAFEQHAAPFIAAGARKSLVQLALQLTLPGIPDIYQGTEWADLSLVDPDNRRPVDFAARASAVRGSGSESVFNEKKMSLLQYLLDVRKRMPALFEQGDYRKLDTARSVGGRWFGFARNHQGSVLIVLASLGRLDDDPASAPAFELPADWQSIDVWETYPQNAKVDVKRTAEAPLLRAVFGDLPLLIALGSASDSKRRT